MSCGNYGYEVYVPRVIDRYLISEHGLRNETDRHVPREELSPSFLDAAAELARRGILRPGIKQLGGQQSGEGSAGSGFTITHFGRVWLDEKDRDDFVPTEPGRFAELIARHQERLGPAFQERAQEAIRCYGAHAPLACCAMCGAAAEAVLLAVTIAKIGDERKVVGAYNSPGGRGRVENMLLGQAKDRTRRAFQGYLELLKYWRDDAAHGRVSDISDNEAFTSLALLLRLTSFVDDKWDELSRADV
ncbi:MAG: hypothetical protein QGM45_11740 [Anaerolineales bacterium]|nr:hypothetical protein [Anaerolineales bacterium]